MTTLETQGSEELFQNALQRINDRKKNEEANILQIGDSLSKEINHIIKIVDGLRNKYESFNHFEMIVYADKDYDNVRDDIIESLNKIEWEYNNHKENYYHLICPARKKYDGIISIFSFGKPKNKSNFLLICDTVVCLLFLISRAKLESLGKCRIDTLDVRCDDFLTA